MGVCLKLLAGVFNKTGFSARNISNKTEFTAQNIHCYGFKVEPY